MKPEMHLCRISARIPVDQVSGRGTHVSILGRPQGTRSSNLSDGNGRDSCRLTSAVPRRSSDVSQRSSPCGRAQHLATDLGAMTSEQRPRSCLFGWICDLKSSVATAAAMAIPFCRDAHESKHPAAPFPSHGDGVTSCDASIDIRGPASLLHPPCTCSWTSPIHQ